MAVWGMIECESTRDISAYLPYFIKLGRKALGEPGMSCLRGLSEFGAPVLRYMRRNITSEF